MPREVVGLRISDFPLLRSRWGAWWISVTPTKGADNFLTLRAGRQLISLGSTRLIATGAGLNVEQPFDGIRLMLHSGQWSADGLAVRPTEVKTGIFDNEPNPTEELWGLYLTRPLPSFHTNLDLYYLGYDHESVRYAQGAGEGPDTPQQLPPSAKGIQLSQPLTQ